MLGKIIIGVAVLALCMAAVPVNAAQKVVLPRGYSAWDRSKEKVVTDKNSLFYGVHYIYADKKSMTAYKAGGKYPEGSQFVVDYFNIKEEAGKPVKGKKNMVVLMKKDAKQTATGGWLFAGFTPDGKHNATLDPIKNCYECHLKEAASTDLVISKFADFR